MADGDEMNVNKVALVYDENGKVIAQYVGDPQHIFHKSLPDIEEGLSVMIASSYKADLSSLNEFDTRLAVRVH